MKSPISQRLVDKWCKSGERLEVWDTKLKNFYLQVRGSGAGTYYIRYSMQDSNVKQTYRLGDAVVLTVTQARGLAQATLASVALGHDPAKEKKQRKTCPTLKEFVENDYLPFIKLDKKSWHRDDSVLRCHIIPALGKKTLLSITTKDIEDLMVEMRDGGKAGPAKGRSLWKDNPAGEGYALSTCNYIAVLLRYMFNLAIEKWNIPGVKDNPAVKVSQFDFDDNRQVFLSPEQIGDLFEAADTKSGRDNQLTLPIIMFLVLTGVRKANALQARWAEIDEEMGVWNIRGHKTKSGKPHSVHLSQEVMILIRQLSSRGKSEYLFPNPYTGRPFTTVYKSWDRIRKAAGLAYVRMHDLRHTFASLLINGGASLFMVQSALGHSDPKMTQRYAHLSDATQKMVVQKAASQLSGFLPQTIFAVQPLSDLKLTHCFEKNLLLNINQI